MTDNPPRAVTRRLLPLPREVDEASGSCSLGPDSPLELQVEDSRVARALRKWRLTLGRRTGGADEAPGRRVRVGVDPGRMARGDGYELHVAGGGIDLVGGSAAGCFYGLQTLRQLAGGAGGTVPCGTIIDRPDFATRGVLCDITRGRVPTVSMLKRLVDRLAGLKINQLQLNLEHAFVFSFDPEICGPADGLTGDEVRELDAYCRERFIELVPALATFGHMGRVLAMPRYRHLAEIEATKSWAEMSWLERVRGLTLDCANPEAHRLIERMWSDVLDAFSSPVVNICGDEPWDLGEGKNRERFAAGGKGVPYVEHLCRTHDICASRGRGTQFWSDVIRGYPDLVERLPRDATVLHWGYDDQADYEGTATFTATGRDTFVCPGTSGWKRIINAMNLSERNIATFAKVGLRHGATGLLTTDWGDHGHFNLPACSAHGIALGAALGWDADHPVGQAFDERFARVVWKVDDAQGVALLRAASAIAEECETWRLLWMPLGQVGGDATFPGADEVAEVRKCAQDALGWCEGGLSTNAGSQHDLRELSVACHFSELFAEKSVLARLARRAPDGFLRAKRDRGAWADRLIEAGRAYAELWRESCKESGLPDILEALNGAADEIRTGRWR